MQESSPSGVESVVCAWSNKNRRQFVSDLLVRLRRKLKFSVLEYSFDENIYKLKLTIGHGRTAELDLKESGYL